MEAGVYRSLPKICLWKCSCGLFLLLPVVAAVVVLIIYGCVWCGFFSLFFLFLFSSGLGLCVCVGGGVYWEGGWGLLFFPFLFFFLFFCCCFSFHPFFFFFFFFCLWVWVEEFLIQCSFIAKCQYNCTRNVLWCQVHSSRIHTNHKPSLGYSNSKQTSR